MTTLVIGYGNPLRGDDGVGWRVVAELAAQETAVFPDTPPPSLTLHTCHQLLPELADPIARAAHVIFVDAAVGGTPGRISRQDVQPRPATGAAFTHHLTPGGLLALARDVYGRSPPATLITISGASFALSEELSTAVAAALPTCVAQIQLIQHNQEHDRRLPPG